MRKQNVIVGYLPVELKWLGLDTGAWARSGLIDCICQDIMESFENLDGCLADDGLIDLDKYLAAKKKRRVLDRYHDFDSLLTTATRHTFYRYFKCAAGLVTTRFPPICTQRSITGFKCSTVMIFRGSTPIGAADKQTRLFYE